MGTLKQKIQAALDTKDAIRTSIANKGGSISEATPFSEYPEIIDTLETGVDTSDGDITPGMVVKGKIGYAKGERVVGNIVTRTPSSISKDGATVTVPPGVYSVQVTTSVTRATRAAPTMSRNGATVTATVNQPAGYVEAGTETASVTVPNAGAISGTLGTTSNLTNSNGVTGSGKVSITGANQSAGYTSGMANGSFTIDVPAGRLYCGRTIRPSTYAQTAIAAEGIAYGAINVEGDPNLLSANIKSGVSIFGVLGSLSGDDHAIFLFTEPEGSRIMSIPWDGDELPNRVLGFWIDDCVLSGNPYPYHIYAFAMTGNLFIAEYEDRDGSYHEQLPYRESVGGGYYDLRSTSSNLAFCNGRWMIAIS